MNNKNEICLCRCHIYGLDVEHIRACCDLVGEKYLNTDKSINYKDYEYLKNNLKKR